MAEVEASSVKPTPDALVGLDVDLERADDVIGHEARLDAGGDQRVEALSGPRRDRRDQQAA